MGCAGSYSGIKGLGFRNIFVFVFQLIYKLLLEGALPVELLGTNSLVKFNVQKEMRVVAIVSIH